MRRLIGLFAGLLLFAPIAMGQYGRYQTCSLQTALGQAVAGAQVYFLQQPANVGALTPQATVYSSPTGGVVTQPVLTNGFGECTAYLSPGVYTVVYVSPLVGTISYPDQNIAVGGGTPSTPSFSAITSGTNTAAAMNVGAGASLQPTGGSIGATAIDGVAVSGTPGTGQVITATSPTAATWQTPTGGSSYFPGTPTVTPSGTPSAGQVLTATSGSAADWQTPTGSGAVSSVSNSDGTLNFSPTTGAVVGSLNLGHANTWTAPQTITAGDFPSQLLGVNCSQATGGATNCITGYFNNQYPGYSYGNGPIGPTGWYGSDFFNTTVYDWSAGIHDLFNVTYVQSGPGDTSVWSSNSYVKNVCITYSDECYQTTHANIVENPAVTATVSGGTAGQTTVPLTSGSGNLMTLLAPMVDLTSAQTGTGTQSGAGPVVGAKVTISGGPTIAASTATTLTANVIVTPPSPNTTGKLYGESLTVNVASTSGITTSEVCDVVGNGDGTGFNEVIQPTAVGSGSITAVFYFSHESGAQLYCGGGAGMYISNNTVSGNYVENVLGSLSGNVLIVGYQVPGGFTSWWLNWPFATPVTLYKGAQIVGVDANHFPSTFVDVQANNTFASGDSVSNLNSIAAGYEDESHATAIANPYATRLSEMLGWSGLGGAGSPWNGWFEFQNGNTTPGTYRGTGGSWADAPFLIYAEGIVSNGIAWEYAPTGQGGVGVLGPNCAGSMLCVGQGPPPDATSQIETIFEEGDNGDTFTYDHANRLYNLWATNGLKVNGYTACTAGNYSTVCPGSWGVTNGYYGLGVSGAAANGHLDDGVTTAGTITSSEPVAVTGNPGLTFTAGTAASGAAGKVVYAVDSTNGYAEVNENNTGLSRVCTVGNYSTVCPGSGGSGISGGVVNEVAIFGSPTTITSAFSLTGGGDFIPTGPNSSVNNDMVSYLGTAGGIQDSGILATSLSGAEVVSFSATPTFSVAYRMSRIVLTGSVTSFALGAGGDGQTKTLCFKQGSGSYTVSPPSNVHGFFTIGTTNGDWNCQSFNYDGADSIWLATTTGVINQ